MQFCPRACQKLAKLTEDGGWQGEIKQGERDCGKLMTYQGKTEDS